MRASCVFNTLSTGSQKSVYLSSFGAGIFLYYTFDTTFRFPGQPRGEGAGDTFGIGIYTHGFDCVDIRRKLYDEGDR
jgi:hypothetical protein